MTEVTPIIASLEPEVPLQAYEAATNGEAKNGQENANEEDEEDDEAEGEAGAEVTGGQSVFQLHSAR